MKMSDFTPDKVGTCPCGNRGKYPRTNGTSYPRVYWKCSDCHARDMKLVMRRRYATPEGREAIIAASKKWYRKKRELLK